MKVVQLFLLLTSLTLLTNAQNASEEVEVIKKVIQSAYVEGIQNEGDIEKIDAGIHPDFNLLGIGENGTIWKLPISEWKERVIKRKKEGKLPRTGDNLVSVKFLSVDVTGMAAVAKFEFYVGEELKYVDYISLYKFSDNWKLVSKIYYQFED
ncbi:nuclear transport factor 2 family protein [Carboxylicivirga marina]|uniref:Nuclear transport factor 2 family protein n=1 Tax=Carboxylicivirga marina TaxID=2800988 RepID=A0ABS1HFM3_9BACT|nr:nuclear transport factor 2 family protein [Carboxylicivirga marina]MBK3516446.1 nuclear transport factor 2 family protein [Carboxylicivirga marina]